MVDYDKIMQGFRKIAAEREAEAEARGIRRKTTSFHTTSFK